MNYRNLEYLHNHVHSTVGGHMGDTLTAASDPIFYLLHSFLDLIWEQWRHKNQVRYAMLTRPGKKDLI